MDPDVLLKDLLDKRISYLKEKCALIKKTEPLSADEDKLIGLKPCVVSAIKALKKLKTEFSKDQARSSIPKSLTVAEEFKFRRDLNEEFVRQRTGRLLDKLRKATAKRTSREFIETPLSFTIKELSDVVADYTIFYFNEDLASKPYLGAPVENFDNECEPEESSSPGAYQSEAEENSSTGAYGLRFDSEFNNEESEPEEDSFAGAYDQFSDDSYFEDTQPRPIAKNIKDIISMLGKSKHLITRCNDRNMYMEVLTESEIAAMDLLAISDAVKSFNGVEGVGQCGETVISVDKIDITAITTSLKKDRADFKVNIHFKNGMKKGSLGLSASFFTMVYAGSELFDMPYAATREIIPLKGNYNPPRFTLEFIYGPVITCSPRECTLDQLLVTFKSFDLKDCMLCPPLDPWMKPFVRAVKINTVALICKETKSAAIAGVFRDESGKWLDGFWGAVAMEDKEKLAFMAVKEALSIAIEKRRSEEVGGQCIRLEIENGFVEKVLSYGIPRSYEFHEIAAECCSLVNKLGNVMLSVPDFAANRAARGLAEAGLQMCIEEGMQRSKEEPNHIGELRDILFMDRTGIILPCTRLSEMMGKNEEDVMKEIFPEQRNNKGKRVDRKSGITLSSIFHRYLKI